MLLNYLKTAWRSLVRHRLYSILNLLGLSVSMGCVLLIALYVTNELRFDAFHEHTDRIFRVLEQKPSAEGDRKLASVSFNTANVALEQIPEVEKATKLVHCVISNFALWQCLLAKGCVAHQSRSYGYAPSSRLAFRQNTPPKTSKNLLHSVLVAMGRRTLRNPDNQEAYYREMIFAQPSILEIFESREVSHHRGPFLRKAEIIGFGAGIVGMAPNQ